MDNSDNKNKIIIIVLVILILLGLITTINLIKSNKKEEIPKKENNENTISVIQNSNDETNNVVDYNELEEQPISTENTSVDIEVDSQSIPSTPNINTNKTIIYTKPVTNNKNNIPENKPNNGSNTVIDNDIKPVENKNNDIQSPILDIRYSVEEKTNKDVVVTISSNEKVQKVEGWDISDDDKVLKKSYSNNTTEVIYVKDIAGNITTVTINIENIDKEKPNLKISYSNLENTNNDVKVIITSDKELQEVKGWKLSSKKDRLEKEYSKNVDEEIIVKDLAGNEVITNILIKNIDKNLPKNPSISESMFLSKNIKTTLNVEDKESGINLDKSFYKIDNLENISDDYSTYKKITDTTMEINEEVKDDGVYYLHIISTDNAGNIKKHSIKLIVDTIKPEIKVKYSITSWTKNDVEVTIESNKPLKELKGWKSSEDGKTFTKTYSNNINEDIELSDLFDRKINATISIKNIDKDSPCEPGLSKTIFNSKPIDNSKNIDITIDATLKDNDGGSGLNLSKCKYILNQSNEKLSDFNNANTFTSENQKLYFTIKENSKYFLHIQTQDNVGNKSYTIHTIISDTLNPIVTREYSNKDMTNQNVIVTVKSNEVLKGKEGWEVYDGGLTLRKEYERNINRTIETFYDIADNPVSVDVTISNIDKVKPNDAVINSAKFNTLKFKVEVKLSDDFSGIDIDKCKFVLDSNEKSNYKNSLPIKKTTDTLEMEVVKDGKYYLHILSVDKAGNEKDTIKEINVDTTSPEYKVVYSKTSITNTDVEVKIESNEQLKEVSGWNLSEDKKSLTKIFSTNVDTQITITDLYGNTSKVDISIKNIDKIKPNATVNYSTTTQTTESVVVTIKANEKIVSTEGWSLSSDEMTLTKTFNENATETVTIRDLAGNYITTSVIVANII